MDFDTIGGVNNDPYSGHSQGGFTYRPFLVSGGRGTNLETPSRASLGFRASPATVRVTDTPSGVVYFQRRRSGGVNSSTATYTVEGFRNNASVLMAAGPLSTPNVFLNVTSPNSTTVLDRLDITIVYNTVSSFNIDNIMVHHVPEPSTLGLVAIAATAGGFVTSAGGERLSSGGPRSIESMSLSRGTFRRGLRRGIG